MQKLFASLCVVLALATAAAPAALGNNGRDSSGSPGRGDNCTGNYQNSSDNWGPNGRYWHACD